MFITFEGPDGSGKTTQIENVYRYLMGVGIDCVSTREPGSDFIGALIREVLLNKETKGLNLKAEFLLFMADRAQHLGTVVLPSLNEGKVVLCDRFFDSSMVYQGIVGGLGVDYVQDLHNLAFGGILPDFTFLLDVDSEIGLSRSICRLENVSVDESRFEDKGFEFQRKIRAGFLSIAKSNPTRFKVIDASRDKDAVWACIKLHLDKIFQLN